MSRIVTACLGATLALLALGACAPVPDRDRVDAGSAPDTLGYTGTIVQSGTSLERITILEQDGAASVRLTGSLEPELENLAGGTVQVSGIWSAIHGGSLDVLEYRLVRIDEAEPFVGVLRDRAGELWLDGERSVRLPAAPAELRQHIGARLWVVGERAGEDAIRLQSYGVIRPR